MVSELHDNIDLVLASKTLLNYELNISGLIVKYLKRSVLVFPVKKEMVKPEDRRLLKVEASFK